MRKDSFIYNPLGIPIDSNRAGPALVPLLNPKFAIAFAARYARTSGSGH